MTVLARPLPCLTQAEACSYGPPDADPASAGPSAHELADRIDTAMLLAIGAVGISVMIAVGALMVAAMLVRTHRDRYLLPDGPRVRRLADEPPAVAPNAAAGGHSVP